MKVLFFALTLFVSGLLTAQSNWTFDSTRKRLYNSIAHHNPIEILGFSESDDEPISWKQADSLYKDMPIEVALKFYSDNSYPIKCYSYLKIMGVIDSIGFSLLPKYIMDSTKLLFMFGDVGVYMPFNQFLVDQYDYFIDSKYYWCDTLHLWSRNYFRREPFAFSKVNYGSWPRILTRFLDFIRPYNIKTIHRIEELKNYRGIESFNGRNY